MNRRWLTLLVRSVLLASIAVGVTNGAISQARTKSTGSTALPAITASAGTPGSPETAAVSASPSASSSSQNSGALDSQPEATAAPGDPVEAAPTPTRPPVAGPTNTTTPADTPPAALSLRLPERAPLPNRGWHGRDPLGLPFSQIRDRRLAWIGIPPDVRAAL